MRRLALLAVAAATVSTPALANPVMAEMLRARQIPHTQHVQVTYAGLGFQPDSGSVGPLSRDTASLGQSWLPFAAGVNLNGGSGVAKYATALQICDCNVPIGSHKYTAKASHGTYDMPVTVAVVDNLEEPDAAVVKPDAMPWDIPDPVEIQGIDCAAWCTSAADSGTADSGTAPNDAATTPADATSPPVDASTAPVDATTAPADATAAPDVSQPSTHPDASSPSTVPTSTAPAATDESAGGGGCSIGARSGSSATLFLIGCSRWLMRRRKRAR
jgi:hypothetical protein